MTRTILGGVLATLVACVTAVQAADEFGTAIDLTAFGAEVSAPASVWDGIPVQEAGQRFDAAPRRLYVSAMLGPSFANEWSPEPDADLTSRDTLLAAGGALGVAFERARGRLRLEVEGMGRSTYDAKQINNPDYGTILTNNWSAMANVWRDFMLTDRFGIYAGAGIGGGGYVLSERLSGNRGVEKFGATNSLAWQGGGGLLWEITDRLTFDAGYRYFRIDTGNFGGDVYSSQFGASELMFALRLYEPLRGWRR